MEIELRRLKESLHEIRGENARFRTVIAKEEHLKKEKGKIEERALQTLADDLRDQLGDAESNAEAMTGKVTPYGFELALNERLRLTTEQY